LLEAKLEQRVAEATAAPTSVYRQIAEPPL
jgi:hypothetical protein